MNTYYIFKDSIVIHTDGKTFLVPATDDRYNALIVAIQGNKLQCLGTIADNESLNEIRALLNISILE